MKYEDTVIILRSIFMLNNKRKHDKTIVDSVFVKFKISVVKSIHL